MSKQLHPAWFQFKPGEQPTDLGIADSLNWISGRIDAIGSLLDSATNDSTVYLTDKEGAV